MGQKSVNLDPTPGLLLEQFQSLLEPFHPACNLIDHLPAPVCRLGPGHFGLAQLPLECRKQQQGVFFAVCHCNPPLLLPKQDRCG